MPQLEYLGSVGAFTHVGDDYTLNLGDIQFGQAAARAELRHRQRRRVARRPTQRRIYMANRRRLPRTPSTASRLPGASLPPPISAGSSFQALTVTTVQNKFGGQSEVITFTPVDTNASGYSQQLSPITLTITDTLKVPDTIYSSAFGDVHILTYNGLQYDFQAVGEFTLAKSNVAGDSFDIQLRLQPQTNSASVTYIQQVAASLGADRVTFGIPSFDRPATVLVDGQAINLSSANPTLTLAGGSDHPGFAQPVEGRLEHRRDDDGDRGDGYRHRHDVLRCRRFRALCVVWRDLRPARLERRRQQRFPVARRHGVAATVVERRALRRNTPTPGA